MEGDNSKKRPIGLDWKVIMDQNDAEPQPLLILETKMEPSPDQLPTEEYARLTDRQLEELIKRQSGNTAKLGPTLRDKEEKLPADVEDLVEKRELRKLQHDVMDVDECDKPTNSTDSATNDKLGSSDGFRQDNASSEVHSKSQFAASFSRRMEENSDCRVVNAFDKELTTLGHCKRQKTRSNGGLSPKRRQKAQSSSRQCSFRCASDLTINIDKHGLSSGSLFCSRRETLSADISKKKDAFQIAPSNGSRPEKTVVLVDEDEIQHVETMEQATELSEHMKDTKIYYPSSDDPESIEICYKDMDCLSPEAFLTSPIMNFYIRYLRLQASPTNKAICDYHFFNTFFYKKLEKAVSYMGRDKESFFVKFRRWWKGVNIFQKAYVFIPIHEDYLREEWAYMSGGHEVVPSDLPISERIWKLLPHRIDEKSIARLIEEAPERLKKKDLAMFGKQWFRPEEASGLRKKIQNLLEDEFQNACESSCILRSTLSSVDGSP